MGDAALIGRLSEQIDYVELHSGDLAATKSFYTSAFGWGFTDYGPTYAAVQDAGLDGGLTTGDTASTTVPLVILKADDLEDALARVQAAGGEITAPIRGSGTVARSVTAGSVLGRRRGPGVI